MRKCKTCKGTGDLVPVRNKKGVVTGKYKPATFKNIKKYAIGGGCIGCCPDCDGSGIEKQDVQLRVDRDGLTGRLQLNISLLNAGGYRLAGPKYNGSSKNLLTVKLSSRDVKEIRAYLDASFPLD